MGLGSYPAIKLASARALADVQRRKLKAGVDPIEARRAAVAERAATITFTEAARAYIAAHEPGWNGPRYALQWRKMLKRYAEPVIGKMDVARIELAHVLKILEPLWHEKRETASRLRARIKKILEWCKVCGYREGENPAVNIKHVLPMRRPPVKHYSAMPWKEMPAFMAELRTKTAMSAKALEFLIYTVARTAEIRGAKWSEIDLEAAVWQIPAERMKRNRLHRVPLTPAAVAILKALPRLNEFVFPGEVAGQPIGPVAMRELLHSMRNGPTVHGMRSTFRDWVAEDTLFSERLAEVALSHIVGSETVRAYQRGDLFEKRRVLMDAWAAYCCGGARCG
jgi:integrase